MKRLTLLLGLVICFSLQVAAQDYSKVSLFGGYQDFRLGKTITPVPNATGWDSSFTYNFAPQVGIQGDFSGSYQTVNGSSIGLSGTYPGHYMTLAAGPVFTLIPKGKVRPFVNALFGATRVSSSVSVDGISLSASKSGFTSQLGGGVDLALSRRFAIRLLQAEWAYMLFGSSGTLSGATSAPGNFKISTGIVFTFPSK